MFPLNSFYHFMLIKFHLIQLYQRQRQLTQLLVQLSHLIQLYQRQRQVTEMLAQLSKRGQTKARRKTK